MKCNKSLKKKVVLQTMREVFPEGLWFVEPPLLLLCWPSIFFCSTFQVLQVLKPSFLLLPKANLHQEEQPNDVGVEEEQQGEQSGEQL